MAALSSILRRPRISFACLVFFFFFVVCIELASHGTMGEVLLSKEGFKTKSTNKHEVLQFDNDHNSPLFPPNYDDLVKIKFRENMSLPEDKKIPRNFWVSFREVPPFDQLPDYILEMANRNMADNWKIMFLDNPAQEEFLERYFPGTSVLWAYRIIHSGAKNSASDIWRIATLYTFGGFYMDDDSFIKTPLEKLITKDDDLVVAQEGNSYKDDCFIPTYHLSNNHMQKTFNSTDFMSSFGGRNLVNWAIFIKPRHPLMAEVLKNVVEIVRKEFLHSSVVKMHRYDARWKYCMCATGPIVFTATVRKWNYMHKNDPEWKIKVQKKDWLEFGGIFKFNINVHYKSNEMSNYFTYMEKHKINLLHTYAPLTVDILNEHAISILGHKEIFFVRNGNRHVIPDYDTFQAMDLKLHNVIKLSSDEMEKIPLKEPLPKMEFPAGRKLMLLPAPATTMATLTTTTQFLTLPHHVE